MAEQEFTASILLVDDEEDFLDIVASKLKGEGYRVVTAEDGVDALKKFKANEIFLVLTDVMMPNMNGSELCLEIRKVSKTVPIALITGVGEEEIAEQAMKGGIKDFFEKPIQFEKLFKFISKHKSNYKPSKGGDDENEEVLKLKFSSKKMRIKIKFNRAATLVTSNNPDSISTKAAKKIREIESSGKASFHAVYRDEFLELWKNVRDNDKISNALIFEMTLAIAAPELKGLSLDESAQDKELGLLSIENPVVAKKWSYDWFELFLRLKLSALGHTEYSFVVPPYAAFLRAKEGQKVQNVPIKSVPAGLVAKNKEKGYAVIANKLRMEIVLVITDVSKLLQKEEKLKLLKSVYASAKHVTKETGEEFEVLKREIVATIERVVHGRERFGYGIPSVSVVAYAPSFVPVETGKVKSKQTGLKSRKTKLVPHIKIVVSSDKMKASISEFDVDYYSGKYENLDIPWLEDELKRHGMPNTIEEGLAKDLLDVIAAKNDLNEMTIALGSEPSGGKQPFVFAVYKHEAQEVLQDDGSLDMREMQQRQAVKAGQLVAETRFGVPPIEGGDVLGEVFNPTDNDELTIDVGEGVEESEPGKFFATHDGIPEVTENSVKVGKVYLHSGNVDMASGNIDFEGVVEIQGAIDVGAKVHVTGDLVVNGIVRGGQLIVGGNLVAKMGIVTAADPVGMVRVIGDIRTTYIENSKVVCQGDIESKLGIRSSDVVCGGGIKVSADKGVIGGGKIVCKESISTSTLGFPMGDLTTIIAGVDGKSAQAINIRAGRLAKVAESQDKDTAELKELSSRRLEQLTEKHKAQKVILRKRVKKYKKLIEKLERHLKKAKKTQEVFADTTITVRADLANNCDISIAGQKIGLEDSYISVMVSSKRKSGTFVSMLKQDKDKKSDDDD